MDGQEDNYPPFLNYENSTRTLTFRPTDFWTSGRQFFFALVIKEQNSASVINRYYCTVEILGEVFERDDKIYWVDVNYTIDYINDKSQGAIKFTEPVNMTYLKQGNFYKMFNIFWRDINYKDNKEDRKLLDFVVDEWGWNNDDMTINFTMTFEKPYELGLLLKKSDSLYVDRNLDFEIAPWFFYNTTQCGCDDDKGKYGN
jgi:hypothetical protein